MELIFPLAQEILTDPTHQGIALGAIVVGVIAGILIALGILIPPAIYFWRKAGPAVRELFGSVRTMAAAPLAPDPKAIADATRDGVRDSFNVLVDSIKELITENRELRQQDQFKSETLEKLQTDFRQLKEQAQQDKVALQTQIDAQCALLGKQNQKIDTLQDTLNAKTKIIQDQEATINQQAEQLKELEALKSRVAELEKKVDLMLEEKEKLLAERDKALNDLLALQAKLNDVTAERDAALARAKQAEAERDAFALRVQNQQTVIGDLTQPLAAPPPTSTEALPGTAAPSDEPGLRPREMP